MLTVKINGQVVPLKVDGLPRLTDVVELIKASIDPDHMITGLTLDGNELNEADWTSNLNRLLTAVLEVETGTPQSFVASRLKTSAEVISTCYVEFREARKLFQTGDTQGGNRRLVQAVKTLQAFFEWYGTLIELVPNSQRQPLDITTHTQEISTTCQKICQQQLYQSWWAVSESIKNELEPRLDSLEDFCRRITY